MNVNRWRGQVRLPPIDAAQVAKDVKKIDTLGVQGDYVELVGSVMTSTGISKPATILGVAAKVDDRQYFVKLTGDPELAQREKANFESFVKSLKFE